MIAAYEGYAYDAKVKKDSVLLMTVDKEKAIDGFEPKNDYYKKNITFDDPMLEAIYDIYYYVKYKDCAEEKDVWYADEGQATGLTSNVENGEITINVANAPKDGSWIQYERGFATKRVSLSDCTEFFVEKKYIKRNGRNVDEIVERTAVPLSVFKNSMIMNRRSNL